MWTRRCPFCGEYGEPQSKLHNGLDWEKQVTFRCDECGFTWKAEIHCLHAITNDEGETLCLRDSDTGVCHPSGCPRLKDIFMIYLGFDEDFVREKEALIPIDDLAYPHQ